MSMEREFCVEKIDAYGALKKLELQYPRNFNFGYDVVDVIAARTPQKKGACLVQCGRGRTHLYLRGYQKIQQPDGACIPKSGDSKRRPRHGGAETTL